MLSERRLRKSKFIRSFVTTSRFESRSLFEVLSKLRVLKVEVYSKFDLEKSKFEPAKVEVLSFIMQKPREVVKLTTANFDFTKLNFELNFDFLSRSFDKTSNKLRLFKVEVLTKLRINFDFLSPTVDQTSNKLQPSGELLS